MPEALAPAPRQAEASGQVGGTDWAAALGTGGLPFVRWPNGRGVCVCARVCLCVTQCVCMCVWVCYMLCVMYGLCTCVRVHVFVVYDVCT